MREDLSIRRKVPVDGTWRQQILLPAGRTLPRRSDRNTQYVFKSRGCDHLRIMLPKSADKRSLTCKLCSDGQQLAALHMSVPSQLEQRTYKHLTDHPFYKIPHPQHWATEAAVFHKHGALENCKADVVFFDGLNVDAHNMKRSVLLFVDGKGHFPWASGAEGRSNRCAEAQCAADKAISMGAASAGFKIVRVAEQDMRSLLGILEVAWRGRNNQAGWVKVSRHWNAGAHLVAAVKIRCA